MSGLSREDVAVIEAAREEIEEPPLPLARGQFGCLGAVAGVVVLGAWPKLLEFLPGLSFFSPFAMLFALVGILGGLVVAMSGGQFGRNAARAAIEASLRILEDAESTRDEELRAATVLLSRAYISQGPSVDQMIDKEEARERIGDRMDVVLDVDRYLLEQHEAWPVFIDRVSGE